MTRAPVAALFALLTTSCGASLMRLPIGPGVAASDAEQAWASAAEACTAVSTMTAEAGVSGSISGERTRARLLIGLGAPAAARLEAYAFGRRAFTLVSTGDEATLLLEQDRRVLQRAPARDVLEALTGLPLGPAGLKAALTGCPAERGPLTGRQHEATWRVISQGPAAHYLRRRDEGAPWQLVAVVRRDGDLEWRMDYGRFVDRLPREIRFTATDRQRFDLRLRLEQVELNSPLTPDVFEVKTPGGFEPITLEELRRSGPLGTGGSQ